MVDGIDIKYKKMESEFQKLNHQDKKEKIINIMLYVKDKIDFASAMKDFIANTPDVSDDFLNNVYQLIMKSAIQNMEEKNDQQSKNMLDNIQKMVLEHQKMDEKEHQDAETLLDDM